MSTRPTVRPAVSGRRRAAEPVQQSSAAKFPQHRRRLGLVHDWLIGLFVDWPLAPG